MSENPHSHSKAGVGERRIGRVAIDERDQCPNRESGGAQCELPDEHEGLCACPKTLAEYLRRS